MILHRLLYEKVDKPDHQKYIDLSGRRRRDHVRLEHKTQFVGDSIHAAQLALYDRCLVVFFHAGSAGTKLFCNQDHRG